MHGLACSDRREEAGKLRTGVAGLPTATCSGGSALLRQEPRARQPAGSATGDGEALGEADPVGDPLADPDGVDVRAGSNAVSAATCASCSAASGPSSVLVFGCAAIVAA